MYTVNSVQMLVGLRSLQDVQPLPAWSYSAILCIVTPKRKHDILGQN